MKKIVCLPSMRSLPSAMSLVSRIDLMLKEHHCERQILPNCMEFRSESSLSVQSYVHQCVLELPEGTSKKSWNLYSTRTLSCYYLHKCIEANPFLKIIVLLGLHILSVHLDIYCSNELLRQGLVHLGHSGVPISCPISRSQWKEFSL